MEEITDSQESYGKIFRSSSIMGGSLVFNYLLGIVRIKVVAVLLGPQGVGILSLYNSALSGINTVSSFGINQSAVRAIADDSTHEDVEALTRTAYVLRITCWGTGALGWLLAVALAYPLSNLLFKSPNHAVAFGVLGVTILLTSITAGQTALLQGLQRIGDIARFNVFSTLTNVGISMVLFALMGERGIVPVLVVSATVTLFVSWLLVRRVPLTVVSQSWHDYRAGVWRLAQLGLALMWSGLLVSGLDLMTRTLISRMFGFGAVGVYQAAWSLSGMFAGFVLNAMGTEFYPRLTAVINDRAQAVRLVNEQTDMGVLLALPGLIGTLSFAPLIIELFYTKQFYAASSLLPWFVVGIFGRVLSWPIGFIMLAKGASRWFMASETLFAVFQLALTLTIVPQFGIAGAAYVFAGTYAVYTIAMRWVGKRLIGFYWASHTVSLLGWSSLLVLASFGARELLHGNIALISGVIATLAAFLFSLHGLASRLGVRSRVARVIIALPGGTRFLSFGASSSNTNK